MGPAPRPDITRRSFVAGAGALGLLALVPEGRVRALLATAPAAGEPGRFLDAHELDTLRALADRLIPGQPEDSTPGALQAGVPAAIDLLLGAFEVTPPMIHAGGPYSGRAGGHARRLRRISWPSTPRPSSGWRIRLEGSRGLREREFAGPVTGLQEIYRSGLAYLDQLARTRHGVDFAAASAAQRDALISDTNDARLQAFLAPALANTLEAMYGPPEYGGNRGLVGWSSNGWRGDSQPQGWSTARVTGPDPLDRRSRSGRGGRDVPGRCPTCFRGPPRAMAALAAARRAGAAMSRPSVMIVGSGAGGSVAAWALRRRRAPRADPGEGAQPAPRARPSRAASARGSATTR